jgi:hypothetical protein
VGTMRHLYLSRGCYGQYTLLPLLR